MARDRAVLLVLAAALGACSGDPENPFADIIQTFAPSSAASIAFTSNGYGQVPGAPRELFSIETSGAGLTRLTFCNVEPRRCDTVLASSAPDRQRMAILRVLDDSDGNGRLTEADGQALLVTDLSRAVEGPLFPQSQQVTGVDWSIGGDVLVYNGVGEGGIDDLFRVDPNGAEQPEPHQLGRRARAAAPHRSHRQRGGVRAHRGRREGPHLHIPEHAHPGTRHRRRAGDGDAARHPLRGRGGRGPRLLAGRTVHRLPPIDGHR